MKLILLKNHPKDQARSMFLYHDMLYNYFTAKGIECESVTPAEFISRPIKSAEGWGRFVVYIDKFVLSPFTIRRKIRSARKNGNQDVIVHIIDQGNAYFTSYLQDIPHLVTCHDAFGMRSAFGLEPLNKRGKLGRLYQNRILSGLKSAFQIACISDFTRSQIEELGVPGKKCRVIYNGLNYSYKPMPKARASAVLSNLFASRNIPAPSTGFIFHLSGNGWYKNRKGVILAYSHLVRIVDRAPALILAGTPLTQELQDLIREKGLSEHVFQCPNSTSEELNALYNQAEFLFYPSVREGFGWPIIEAQASGGVVITSDRAPMNEIGGDCAIYCTPPPEDGKGFDEWSRQVAEQTLQPALQMTANQRNWHIEKGIDNAANYSADKMCDSYEMLYRECIKRFN